MNVTSLAKKTIRMERGVLYIYHYRYFTYGSTHPNGIRYRNHGVQTYDQIHRKNSNPLTPSILLFHENTNSRPYSYDHPLT